MPEMLKFNTNLHTLFWTDHAASLNTIADDLMQMLSHAGCKRLQNAAIYLQIDHFAPLLDRVAMTENWKRFARMFEEDTFTELRSLRICFKHRWTLPDAERERITECLNILEELFPRLYGRNVLNVSIIADWYVKFNYSDP
jgi:hypothetical protein